MICYDCKTEVTDIVYETRQVSGGDGVVYAGDFRTVPVCANRHVCVENSKRTEDERIRFRTCIVCGQDIRFTSRSEGEILTAHIRSHSVNEIAERALTHLFGFSWYRS